MCQGYHRDGSPPTFVIAARPRLGGEIAKKSLEPKPVKPEINGRIKLPKVSIRFAVTQDIVVEYCRV